MNKKTADGLNGIKLKDRVLQAIDLRKYFSVYFPQATNAVGEITVCSPFRDEKHPSFSINLQKGLWHDHSTGDSGDIFSFEQRMSGSDFPAAVESLARFCGLHDGEIRSKKGNRTMPAIADAEQYARALFSREGMAAKEFLNVKRGFSDETLNRFHVGFDAETGEIRIPVFDAQAKAIVQWRHFLYDFASGEKKIKTIGKSVLFGAQYLQNIPEDEVVVIVEGELDAMILHQYGFVAVTGTAGALTWKDDWNELLAKRRIVVCYDSDATGRRGAKKVRDVLLDIAADMRMVDIFGNGGTKEMKDVTDYLVKGHHTAEDFKLLISAAPVIPKEINGLSAKIYEELKSENVLATVHPAQDFCNGVFYYGMRIGEEQYLVSSKKKCIPFTKCDDEGIVLTKSNIEGCGFPRSGVLRFFESKETVNAFETFDAIRQYIRRYVLIPDDSVYSFLALWVMGTYLFRIFRYFPYVHVNGEKGTGKTLLMEILRPIAFNGQLMVNSTEAVIFRDIQNTLPTLFLDEIERLRKDDRERHGAVMDVLKAGFSKTGVVKRCGGRNKDTVMAFSCYSPKVLAGINDLDDVLRDRTITLRTVRRLSSEKVDQYRENKATILLQEEIRIKLYLFGLQYGPEIANLYNENAEEIPGLDHLNNRELDIWTPIILLASIVDVGKGDGLAHTQDVMVEFSRKRIHERRQDDSQENDTTKLLLVLTRMMGDGVTYSTDGNSRLYDTSDVFDYFKTDDDFSWLEKKTWLTRRIKKLGITVKTVRRGSTTAKTYVIDAAVIDDLKKRFLLPEDESETVTEDESQHIH